MSLSRELNRAALDFNLGKNALKVFMALMDQTIGYGKETDRLTDRRVAYLSRVRIDRCRPAIQAVLSCGLFSQREAKQYQYRYTIGEKYLSQYPNDCYTPALPKNRENLLKTETISEKERHTALDLNLSLSTSLKPLQDLLTSCFELLKQQTQLVAQLQTQAQTSLNLASTSCRANPSDIEPSTNVQDSNPKEPQDLQQNSDIDVAIEPQKDKKSLSEKPLKNGEASPRVAKKQNLADREPISAPLLDQEQDQKQDQKRGSGGIQKLTSEQETLVLPEVIAAVIPPCNQPRCLNLLTELEPQQQQDVFQVFIGKLERDEVERPTGLLNFLTGAAKNSMLNMPDTYQKPKAKQYIPYSPSNPNPEPVMICSESERLVKQEREALIEQRMEENSLRDMAKNYATFNDCSVEEAAKILDLNHLF